MLEIGQKAPRANVKFTTKDVVNQPYNLGEAYDQGTTVLYFFPAAFTGVCTKSSCELRDDISEFSALEASIYGISVDMPFSQKLFITQNDINYPILSDWNREAIESFDIVDNAFAGNLRGVARRAVFVIKDGVVTYSWTGEHPGIYPPFDEVKANLKT